MTNTLASPILDSAKVARWAIEAESWPLAVRSLQSLRRMNARPVFWLFPPMPRPLMLIIASTSGCLSMYASNCAMTACVRLSVATGSFP